MVDNVTSRRRVARSPGRYRPGSLGLLDGAAHAVTRGRAYIIRGVSDDRATSGSVPGVDDAAPTPPWQERAVARRIGDVRARALARSSRILATALELMQETGQASFTLQTLADRANLSLRTFYQHFAGKEELLLALYEDVTTQFTQEIEGAVAQAQTPLEKLKAWCTGVLARPGLSQEVGGRVVLIYNLSLELERPEEFSKVWEPQRQLLTDILTSCAEANLIRTDLTVKQLTSLLGSTLTSLGQYNALHGGVEQTSLDEDVVWSWCAGAISPSAARS